MSLLLGPRTLSWPTIVLISIAGPLGALVSDPSAGLRDRLAWLGVGVVAQVALVVVYVAAARLGAGRSRLAVLAAVIVGSGARAVVLILALGAVGLSDPLDVGPRLLSATVTFTVWGILLGALVQAWADYRDSLRALLRRVDRAVAEADELSEEWRSRLRSTTSAPADLARTAAALQADIEGRLRPLSHRLWFGITDRQSRRRFLHAIMTEPLPIRWIAVVSFALYAWTVSYTFGLVAAVIAAMGTAAAMALILSVADRLAAKASRRRVAIRLAAMAIALLVPAGIDAVTTNFRDLPGLAAVTVGLGMLIFALQAITVSAQQRRSTLESIARRVDALDADRAAVASQLHTTMQSRWTAAALRLQGAAETGDVASAHQAIADARAVFDEASPRAVEPTDLADLARSWEGIAAITVHVPPDVPDSTRSTLSLIVEEAIANAVRHGRARTIEVLVTVTAASVDVVVADDGSGVGVDAQPGFGSRWLDEVATWHLTSDLHGSRLSASIPCRPEP